MTDYRTRVFEALDNALANGFNFTQADVDEVAIDLGTYEPYLNGIEVEVMKPAIVEWQERHAAFERRADEEARATRLT